MTNYVRGASISCAAFRAEIQEMLTRYGATGFRYGWEEGRTAIAFTAGGRHFRFVLVLPGSTADPLQPRRTDPAAKPGEDASRQRWQKLSMLIRAKLEAVAAGVATFDEEFLAYMVLPGGGTVSQAVAPSIDAAYAGTRTGLPGDRGIRSAAGLSGAG